MAPGRVPYVLEAQIPRQSRAAARAAEKSTTSVSAECGISTWLAARPLFAKVKAGNIRPLLDRALPLRDAAEAHRLIANNEVKGNIVLLPWAA